MTQSKNIDPVSKSIDPVSKSIDPVSKSLDPVCKSIDPAKTKKTFSMEPASTMCTAKDGGQKLEIRSGK